jgi:methyl acetate hydrolase
VLEMEKNQIGDLAAGRMGAVLREWTEDMDMRPGVEHGFGFGFLINNAAYATGRPAGTRGWTGLANTFYWLDRGNGICAVLLMQMFPFLDSAAMGMLEEFERTVYGGGMLD